MSPEKMSEAEVSLRVAFYLMHMGLAKTPIQVAIDGAQIQTRQRVHFDITSFLKQSKCAALKPSESWRGAFHHCPTASEFVIHSNPGRGDVVAELQDGRILRVESKKGPLIRSRSSSEYPLLREALGQLLTMAKVEKRDVLAAAVPHSTKFAELATSWRKAPLIRKTGILILTVGRDNQVHGLELGKRPTRGLKRTPDVAA